MSTLTSAVAVAENMAFEKIVSPRTLFTSILNDKTLKAANKQCKSECIKCTNEILPRHPIWYTRQSGIQKVFAGLRLPNVQTKDSGDVRHYTSSTKERNGSRHTLEWAEQRGNHMVVVSRQEARLLCRETPSKRKAASALPTNHGIRHEISQRMKEVQRGILWGKHLNRVFYVVKIKDTPEEAIWYHIRKVPQHMRTFKSPLTLTEKAREQWRVEQKYTEKQQYKWKHLTPESSKSP